MVLTAMDAVAIDLPVTPFAASYAAWPADGDVRPLGLDCEGPGGEGARARLRLLALDRWGRALEQSDVAAADDSRFSLRLAGPQDPLGETLLVAASVGTAPIAVRCAVERSEIVVVPTPGEAPLEGDGCSCAGGATPPSRPCPGCWPPERDDGADSGSDAVVRGGPPAQTNALNMLSIFFLFTAPTT